MMVCIMVIMGSCSQYCCSSLSPDPLALLKVGLDEVHVKVCFNCQEQWRLKAEPAGHSKNTFAPNPINGVPV